MTEKKIMGEKEIAKKLKEMAAAIINKNKAVLSDLVLVGIIERGSNLAERLVEIIKKETGQLLPFGKVDVSIYRDDLDIRGDEVTMFATDISIDINEKIVVLIDDVIFKGRTARAALDVLNDYGRPREVQLYALVDRGGRELPIQPNYSAEIVNVNKGDKVQVLMKEKDGQDAVLVKQE